MTTRYRQALDEYSLLSEHPIDETNLLRWCLIYQEQLRSALRIADAVEERYKQDRSKEYWQYDTAFNLGYQKALDDLKKIGDGE